ncbi:MAG: adenine deaminase, partial [Actinomycetia bacterium]|nr:adenine deaminase [Actinomycetes bacterium]
ADVLCFSALDTLEPTQVFQRGRLVAADGVTVPGAVASSAPPAWMLTSMHLARIPAAAELLLEPPAGGTARVIGLVPGQLLTRHLVLDVTANDVDVARIAVLERHRETGRVGLGWVFGFGLQRGAIASTVAHDAHNCMVVGGRQAAATIDMAAAIGRLAEIGGGQVAVLDGKVVGEIRLPIGGLMSPDPAGEVARQAATVTTAAHELLGVTVDAPFMQLSFLGLSVLPHLRITDLGLVDVDQWKITTVAP